jgi:DNA end-binding protein Ku
VAPRALWKGHLKIDELTCAVALYAAASTAERVSLHTINRKTGHRVHREYVDADTGKEVEREDQVKGYETDKDRFIVLEPDEIASAVPESDKTLAVEAFIKCDDIDTVYFDKPYFVAPADKAAADVFAVVREGMEAKKVAALARAVLFRRVRKLLIRTEGPGFVANTLKFDYEVRPAEEVFEELPELKIKGEMLELAEHIIETKSGEFDPAAFDDRYDAALADLVKAKMEGRKIEAPKRAKQGNVVSLMDALRESARAAGKGKAAKAKAAPKKRQKAAPQRKAG